MIRCSLFFVLMIISLWCKSQNIDSTFANQGVFYIYDNDEISTRPDRSYYDADEQAYYMAYDGSIVKFKADGTVDTTYGVNGRLTIDHPFIIFDKLVVLPNNKILSTSFNSISHFHKFAMYNLDGTLDSTFHDDGYNFYDFGTTRSMDAVYPFTDGSFIFGGVLLTEANDWYLAKIAPNGYLDSTFGDAGVASIDMGAYIPQTFDDIDVLENGDIVVTGKVGTQFQANNDFGVARLKPNGTSDSSFGTSGFVKIEITSSSDQPQQVVFTANDQIQINGWCNGVSHTWCACRLDEYGNLVESFGDSGVVMNSSYGNGTLKAIYDPLSELVMSSSSSSVIRIKDNGTSDSSFAVNGKLAFWPFLPDSTIAAKVSDILLLENGDFLIYGDVYDTTINNRYAFGMKFVNNLLVTDERKSTIKEDFLVYPNPVHDRTMLHLKMNSTQQVSVKIMDTKGTVIDLPVLEETFQAGSYEVPVDFHACTHPGIYILEVCMGKRVQRIKIIKQ